MIYRQGDVLLVKVEKLPSNAVDVTPEERIVLAYGEVTGHAHALYEPKTQLIPQGKVKAWDAGAEKFIQVLEKTALRHEEHSPIVLDPGNYKVIRQREYDPVMDRVVED